MRARWRLYYCRVCGHLEWLAEGEELPRGFECPLCEAPRAAFVSVDGRTYTDYALGIDEVAPALQRIDRIPPFPYEWQHYAYLLLHPSGPILYDAPPVITERAIEQLLAFGRPRQLIVSHRDFLGPAQLWADALELEIWMGNDTPIGRNRVEVDRRVSATAQLLADIEIVSVPGHSPGSIALYWRHAPGGPILCPGDALAVSPDREGNVQLAFFQEPPVGAEIAALVARPVDTLAACGGALRKAAGWLERLLATPDNCARPWMGQRGGVWLSATEAGQN